MNDTSMLYFLLMGPSVYTWTGLRLGSLQSVSLLLPLPSLGELVALIDTIPLSVEQNIRWDLQLSEMACSVRKGCVQNTCSHATRLK